MQGPSRFSVHLALLFLWVLACPCLAFAGEAHRLPPCLQKGGAPTTWISNPLSRVCDSRPPHVAAVAWFSAFEMLTQNFGTLKHTGTRVCSATHALCCADRDLAACRSLAFSPHLRQVRITLRTSTTTVLVGFSRAYPRDSSYAGPRGVVHGCGFTTPTTYHYFLHPRHCSPTYVCRQATTVSKCLSSY